MYNGEEYIIAAHLNAGFGLLTLIVFIHNFEMSQF